MGIKEYQFAGDNKHLLNEYHRQLDSLKRVDNTV